MLRNELQSEVEQYYPLLERVPMNTTCFKGVNLLYLRNTHACIRTLNVAYLIITSQSDATCMYVTLLEFQ